ncbi:hypothetical protein D3C81_1365590 [compost metagenome]
MLRGDLGQARIGAGIDLRDNADPVALNVGCLDGNQVGFRSYIRSCEVLTNAVKQCRGRRAITVTGQHRDLHFARCRATSVAILDLRSEAVRVEGVSDIHHTCLGGFDPHRRTLAEGENFAAILHPRTCCRRMGRQVITQASVVVTFINRRHRRECRRIAGIEQLPLKAHVRQPRIEIAARCPPRQHLFDASVVFAFVGLQPNAEGFKRQGEQFAFVFQAGLEFRGAVRRTHTDVFDDEGLELGEQIFERFDVDQRGFGQLVLAGDQHAHVTTSKVC